MSCGQPPRPPAPMDEARRPRRSRLISLLAAACLAGSALLGCSVAGEVDRSPPARASVLSGLPGMEMAEAERTFAKKRARFVKKLNRTLGQVDEQIEMIDDTIEARQASNGDATDTTRSSEAARAVLEADRDLALAAIEEAKLATMERWLDVRWRAAETLENLESSCNTAAAKLY